jgi:threonyl-tRNA synthetase
MTQQPMDLFGYAASIGAKPELTPDALAGLSKATARVYELLKDGHWHSATSIIEASGIREGLRRVRELRQRGMKVDCRLQEGSKREFEYRLLKP